MEQRSLATEPLRWHMQLSVFDMIDIAVGEFAAGLDEDDARSLTPETRLNRGSS
jgi:hypothetical protein